MKYLKFNDFPLNFHFLVLEENEKVQFKILLLVQHCGKGAPI